MFARSCKHPIKFATDRQQPYVKADDTGTDNDELTSHEFMSKSSSAHELLAPAFYNNNDVTTSTTTATDKQGPK